MNDTTILIRAVVFVALSAVLAACTGNVQEPVAKPGVAAVPAEVQASIEAPQRKESMIERLLAQGDAAFERGRYTLPEEDNALDRYRAVLMLDPDNPEARGGLDSVLLAYIDHVRSVLSAGHVDSAMQLLRRAEDAFPEAPLLQQLREEVEQAQRAAKEAVTDADVPPGEKILLSREELDQRSDEVVAVLTALAQRVRESEESVMIMARSDREGRWIYKIMQEAAADYRIRGDIRISRLPAVVLMAPL